MTKDITKFESAIVEIQQLQNLCSQLMKTPHYAKMGEAGIFAITQKAKSIGMDPLDALNGAMYFVQGRCELSGQAMLALIRCKGHSVSMDPKSTDDKVIMYGKRCDNNDTWRVEFSIEDAKKQGIYRNQWEKMPKVMCMWRCVSQLGRFLFSDVLKGVYVTGEVQESVGLDVDLNPETGELIESDFEDTTVVLDTKLTEDQIETLRTLEKKLSTEYVEKLYRWMKVIDIGEIGQKKYKLTLEAYERAVKLMEMEISQN